MYTPEIEYNQNNLLKSIFPNNINYLNNNEEVIMSHLQQQHHEIYGTGVLSGNEAMENGQLCLICSDKATGKHYGAYSCDGCKGFFRRSVRKKNNYTCQYNKNCKMDKDKRNQCRYCRLKKCILMGMKRTAVQNERDRISTRRSSFDDVAPNMVLSIPQLIQAEQRVMVQNSKPINSDEMYNRFAEVPDVCESMKSQLYLLVTWAKSLPCFMQLTLQEQIAVLKAHAGEILILGVIRRSFQLEEENSLLLGNNLIISRNSGDKHFAEIASHILDDLFIPLRELQLDDPEFACLKAIVFFDPNVVNVTEPNKEFLRRCRHSIQVDLMNHMNDKQYHRPGRFGELLLLIPDLRLVTQLMVKKVEFVKMTGLAEIDNLLSETLLGDNSMMSSFDLTHPQHQHHHYTPNNDNNGPSNPSGTSANPQYEANLGLQLGGSPHTLLGGHHPHQGTSANTGPNHMQQQQQQQLQQQHMSQQQHAAANSPNIYAIPSTFMQSHILMDMNQPNLSPNDVTSNFWRSYLPPTSDSLYTVFANQPGGAELLQQHQQQMSDDNPNKLCSMIMNSDGMTVIKSEDILQQQQQHHHQTHHQHHLHQQHHHPSNAIFGDVSSDLSDRYNNNILMTTSRMPDNNNNNDNNHDDNGIQNVNEHFLINLEQPYGQILTTNDHQQLLINKYHHHHPQPDDNTGAHSDISDESGNQGNSNNHHPIVSDHSNLFNINNRNNLPPTIMSSSSLITVQSSSSLLSTNDNDNNNNNSNLLMVSNAPITAISNISNNNNNNDNNNNNNNNDNDIKIKNTNHQMNDSKIND